MDTHPDLTFATLDPTDDAGRNAELLEGWGQALARGFHQGRMEEPMRRAWLEHCRADAIVVRGAWPVRSSIGSGTVPVATYASFEGSLNAGAEQLPLRMITDVTVAPTHRRRGLLRRLIVEDLRDAAGRGVPLAALTASEGTIYGRFGFGPATFLQHVEVASRSTLRGPVADGHLELVEPEEAWLAVRAVFARFHRERRGSVDRPQFYESLLTGRFTFESGGPDPKLRAAVHLDPSGEPVGHVLYRHVGREDGKRTVDVVDLVATGPASYLRLWRYLLDLDLVEQVRWQKAPVDDPLGWALEDPYARRVVKVGDLLWLRVLDVARALEARPWGADGEVVLGVDDELGHAAGCWRVTTREGRASVSATDTAPDVTLSADTLGSLQLGGVTVDTLVAAGRVGGHPEALTRFAAMATSGPAPYCITGF